MIKNAETINWDFNTYSIIQELLKEVDDWEIKYLSAGQYNWRDFKWIHVYKKSNKIPTSGWKIHVSASIFNADKILERILPVLLKCCVNFKVASNIDFLAFLNNNPINKRQAGKYITIYPTDSKQAQLVAEAIHQKTLDFLSPPILSDKQYRPGSIVYYRYGSFIAQYVQSLWGSLMSIMNVEGRKEFDFKNPNPKFMDKIVDPFNNIALSRDMPTEESLGSNKITNKIYIEYFNILETESTQVVLCLDIQKKRRCILKRATPDTSHDLSGYDAVERLKIEENILQKLNNTKVAPIPFDSFYDSEGRYCIIMEDFPGISLADYLQFRVLAQKTIPIKKIIKWSVELAKKMMVIHQNNILHSDLKLANILVVDGALVLIDFDSASDLDKGSIVRTCGSVGFSTYNRDRGNVPTIQDDIYAYGAVLYYLFGMVNPNVNPLEPDQTDTSLAYLNDNLPAKYIKLVHDCLAGKFNSFSEIVSFIKTRGGRCEQISSLKNNLDIKNQKLIYILDQYVKSYYRDNLKGSCYNETVIGDIVISDLRGMAGSIIGLTTVGISQALSSINPLITQCAQELLEKNLPYNKIPGLYVGESGKAVALLYAAFTTNDNLLKQRSIKYMQDSNAMPLQSVDLFNGAAGRIRANLIFYVLTDDLYFYNIALSQTDFLIQNMVTGKDYVGWYNPTVQSTPDKLELDKTEILLGYAHGIAGIGDALLDMYLHNNDQSLLEIIRNVITSLMQYSQKAHAGKSLLWSEALEGSPLLSFWCHGGAGIAIFICRAMHYGILPRDDSLIQKLVYPIVKYTRGSAPILCHGSVGNLACLLDINQYCSESISHETIDIFENIIAVWLRNYFNNLMKTSNVQIAFVGYLTGIAGIMALYARLVHPEMPNPLSLEFAKYLKERS